MVNGTEYRTRDLGTNAGWIWNTIHDSSYFLSSLWTPESCRPLRLRVTSKKQSTFQFNKSQTKGFSPPAPILQSPYWIYTGQCLGIPSVISSLSKYVRTPASGPGPIIVTRNLSKEVKDFSRGKTTYLPKDVLEWHVISNHDKHYERGKSNVRAEKIEGIQFRLR